VKWINADAVTHVLPSQQGLTGDQPTSGNEKDEVPPSPQQFSTH